MQNFQVAPAPTELEPQTETPASSPSGRKSSVISMSPVILEAAKEMDIQVNPSAEVLEAAFESFITENQVKAGSLDVDEQLNSFSCVKPVVSIYESIGSNGTSPSRNELPAVSGVARQATSRQLGRQASARTILP
jgi:hypothetical protein